MNEPLIKILIVDDHFIVRIGLIALINTEPGMKVVGEADDGDRAIELFQKLKPDLVLMDSPMPGISGHESTQKIRLLTVNARVLMLSRATKISIWRSKPARMAMC